MKKPSMLTATSYSKKPKRSLKLVMQTKKAYLLKLFDKKLKKEVGTHTKFFAEVFKDV